MLHSAQRSHLKAGRPRALVTMQPQIAAKASVADVADVWEALRTSWAPWRLTADLD